MNFCSIVIRVSGSPNLWKRACTTVAAPMAAGVKTDPSDKASEKAKAKIYKKLQSLTTDYLNLITREEEQKCVSVTEADLARWAKRISKDGKNEQALEIYEWMENKKMTFSPSQLEHFVILTSKIKGASAAHNLFQRVDPYFETSDPHAKNWPAFSQTLDVELWERSVGRPGPRPRATLLHTRKFSSVGNDPFN